MVRDSPSVSLVQVVSTERFRAAAITIGLTATQRLRRRADRYIAVSNPVSQGCRSLVADSQRPIAVIPPFLPDESFQILDAPRPAFVPAEGPYVMFAGALGPHKGVDVLFEA